MRLDDFNIRRRQTMRSRVFQQIDRSDLIILERHARLLPFAALCGFDCTIFARYHEGSHNEAFDLCAKHKLDVSRMISDKLREL